MASNRRQRFRSKVVVMIAVPLVFGALAAFAAVAPGLGTAGDFAVLAGSAISNTGPTTITGDVGIHPGDASSVTGFGSVTLNGDLHTADGVALSAKNDLVTAYNTAAGSGPVSTIGTELGGATLLPGVYDSADGTFEITGTLILNAEGDPDAVFVFLTESTLKSATGAVVSIINSGQACNVFWQVGSSATIEAGTTFRGNILALESITLVTGASVEGRVLARNGAVTMDTNTITRAVCQSDDGSGTTTTTSLPDGPIDTGGGSTSGIENGPLLILGAALLAGGVAAFALGRRLSRRGAAS
ncbi:MAG: ice-binding family protein [Acidimicrobiia bacterium]